MVNYSASSGKHALDYPRFIELDGFALTRWSSLDSGVFILSRWMFPYWNMTSAHFWDDTQVFGVS